MASCIETLAITGSRKSDGSVNAGGLVFLTQPGSANSAVTAYQDAAKSAAVSLVSGGYALDAAGKAVLFVENPCTVRITDTTGATVDTFAFGISTNAGLVEVTTPGWTGVNSSGSATSGAQTYLDKALASIYASVGGLDGKYRGVYGIADTNLKAEIEQIGLTPQRFGARGDGVTDDTTAWLNMAAAQAASGLTVFIPRGTYKITQVIQFGSSVIMRGVGRSPTTGSVIVQATAGATALRFLDGATIDGINVQCTGGGGGTGIFLNSSLSGFPGRLANVSVSGTGALTAVNTGSGSGAANIVASSLAGTSAAIFGNAYIDPQTFLSGTATSTVVMGATFTSETSQDLANGGNITPTAVGQAGIIYGYQRIRATSAGAGTINVVFGVSNCCLLTLECFNNSGGAFTFTLASGYKNAGNPAPANGSRTTVTFAWNSTDLQFTETGRATTT